MGENAMKPKANKFFAFERNIDEKHGGRIPFWQKVRHPLFSKEYQRLKGNQFNKVGLFGTCGNSTWREGVIKSLDQAGVGYFNPQVKEWTPECAKVESENLVKDKVILFVITAETEAYGSLAETGWAAVSALLTGRKVGYMLEMTGNKDPDRARKLVQSHITQITSQMPSVAGTDSIYIAKDLDELVGWAIRQMKG